LFSKNLSKNPFFNPFMKIIVLIAMGLIGAYSLSAQDTVFRVCHTDQMHEQLLASDPEYGLRRALIQKAARLFMEQGLHRKTTPAANNIQFIVPVVFHIIHNYGSENISREQVMDALKLINESFQKKSPDTGDVIAAFQPVFANCQIEFRLAQIDPNGNCHDGITRTQSLQTYSAGDGVKSLINWPSHKYLNIWVVANIASGAAGYAYYPGASPQVDGIVIRHDYTGGIGTSPGTTYHKRALTHEIGHYLDLPHTWGSTNQPGLSSNCTIDDGIFDTPNTIGIDNFSCNTSQVSCGSLDNVQNYMDYGSCPKMFTEGQKDRMHTTLYTSRDYLVSLANNVDTGTDDDFIATPCTPIADFSNRKKFICANEPVQFKDLSWRGIPDNWTWLFPGAVPSMSNDTNPVVVYPNPGIYDVTLTVSNAAGSHTLVRQGHVVVSANPASYSVPYAEGFESMSSFPPSNHHWYVNHSSGINPWTLTGTAAYSGSKSLFISNFPNATTGSVVELITPSFDLTYVTNASLSFQLAFARRISSSVDSLKIYVSKDCGTTWTLRYNKSGTNLATTTTLYPSQPFIPQLNQWRQETVSIASPSYNNQPNIKFLFRYYHSAGNNIFIDDLNLSGTVGLSDHFSEPVTVAVYPNPASETIHLSLTLDMPSRIKVTMFDLFGQRVKDLVETRLDAGEHLIRSHTKVASGVYWLRLTTDSSVIYQRLVISR
jgi:PKD repeat protein